MDEESSINGGNSVHNSFVILIRRENRNLQKVLGTKGSYFSCSGGNNYLEFRALPISLRPGGGKGVKDDITFFTEGNGITWRCSRCQ